MERKRHIGNDIVNIIFMDGSREDMAKFKPAFIKSQFTHVYAVVCYEEETSKYFLTVYSEETVPLFGPGPVPSSGFSDHQLFRCPMSDIIYYLKENATVKIFIREISFRVS